MAVIGGFRSYLSIIRKTDGNFGNVSAGVLFSKLSRVSMKTVVKRKKEIYQLNTIVLKLSTVGRQTSWLYTSITAELNKGLPGKNAKQEMNP